LICDLTSAAEAGLFLVLYAGLKACSTQKRLVGEEPFLGLKPQSIWAETRALRLRSGQTLKNRSAVSGGGSGAAGLRVADKSVRATFAPELAEDRFSGAKAPLLFGSVAVWLKPYPDTGRSWFAILPRRLKPVFFRFLYAGLKACSTQKRLAGEEPFPGAEAPVIGWRDAGPSASLRAGS